MSYQSKPFYDWQINCEVDWRVWICTESIHMRKGELRGFGDSWSQGKGLRNGKGDAHGCRRPSYFYRQAEPSLFWISTSQPLREFVAQTKWQNSLMITLNCRVKNGLTVVKKTLLIGRDYKNLLYKNSNADHRSKNRVGEIKVVLVLLWRWLRSRLLFSWNTSAPSPHWEQETTSSQLYQSCPTTVKSLQYNSINYVLKQLKSGFIIYIYIWDTQPLPRMFNMW